MTITRRKPLEPLLNGRTVIDIYIERGNTRSSCDAFISEAWFEDTNEKLNEIELEKLQKQIDDYVQHYAVRELECHWE
jgi:hypothetical protein